MRYQNVDVEKVVFRSMNDFKASFRQTANGESDMQSTQ